MGLIRNDASQQHRRRESLLLVPPLVFTAIVYYPVTRTCLHHDDFLHLYQIANDSFLQFWVTPNGGHVYLTRNLIFYLMSVLFGTHPEPYYWTSFLTHLVNVWLLFRVLLLFTHSTRLACFGATLWGISPFSEETLGWYAVYGHALVGTLLLIILDQALRAAEAARPPSRRTLCLWYALALMAATSFGVGVGIAMVLPFVLLLLLHPAGPLTAWRLPPLISLVVVVPALYWVVMWAYTALSGVGPGLPPSVTLSTPAAIPVYSAHLIALGLTRLLFGAYFPPWLTVGFWYGVLGCFMIALVGVLRRSGTPVRRQIAACLLLLLACYGMVALGRAYFMAKLPMSTFVLFSRYHYVGQLVLAILLCILLAGMSPALPLRARWIALWAWFAVAIVVYMSYGTAIDTHLEARKETENVLASIQAAIEAQPRGEAVYIPNRVFGQLPLPGMFPGWAAVFTIFYSDNTVDGRTVYFIDNSPGALGAALHGRRTRTLVVRKRRSDGG